MVNPQLLNYIKQQPPGTSREEIKQALQSSGWQSKDIDEAFGLVFQKHPPVFIQNTLNFLITMKKVDILLIIFILLGGCALILFTYFRYFNETWTLVDHSNKVPFTTGRDGTFYGTFYDMKSNGDFWLLGRNAYGKWEHFYKYSVEGGFENLSSKVPESDINYISWNGKFWILANQNYFQNKSRIIKFDGKNFTDLSDRFRQLSCKRGYEQTYESLVNAVFTNGNSFVFNYTGPCYVQYDGDRFKDVTDSFPKNGKDRESYVIGDCDVQACYLAPDGGTNKFIVFNSKDKIAKEIFFKDITGGKINDIFITSIKTNSKIVLFELSFFNKEKVKHLILQYDPSSRKTKENFVTEYSYNISAPSEETFHLAGWDQKFLVWVILGSKCESQVESESKCEGKIYHMHEDKLSLLPIESFEFDISDFKMEVSSGNYMISSRNRLYEVRYARP